jgi:hypothetical protein
MVRTSLRNLITGTTVDETFRISEKITTAEIDKYDAIFSFIDGENVVFLNSDSFDEIYIPVRKSPPTPRTGASQRRKRPAKGPRGAGDAAPHRSLVDRA